MRLGNGYLETVSKYQIGCSPPLVGPAGRGEDAADQVRAFGSQNDEPPTRIVFGDLEIAASRSWTSLNGRNQEREDAHRVCDASCSGIRPRTCRLASRQTVITAARVELALGKYKQAEAYARDALRIFGKHRARISGAQSPTSVRRGSRSRRSTTLSTSRAARAMPSGQGKRWRRLLARITHSLARRCPWREATVNRAATRMSGAIGRARLAIHGTRMRDNSSAEGRSMGIKASLLMVCALCTASPGWAQEEPTPTSTRTVVLQKADKGYRWAVMRAPMPELKDHQVLIHVRAVALNRGDLEMLEPSGGQDLSGLIVASDAAGDVVAVGKAVKDVRPGQKSHESVLPQLDRRTAGSAEAVAGARRVGRRRPGRLHRARRHRDRTDAGQPEL